MSVLDMLKVKDLREKVLQLEEQLSTLSQENEALREALLSQEKVIRGLCESEDPSMEQKQMTGLDDSVDVMDCVIRLSRMRNLVSDLEKEKERLSSEVLTLTATLEAERTEYKRSKKEFEQEATIRIFTVEKQIAVLKSAILQIMTLETTLDDSIFVSMEGSECLKELRALNEFKIKTLEWKTPVETLLAENKELRERLEEEEKRHESYVSESSKRAEEQEERIRSLIAREEELRLLLEMQKTEFEQRMHVQEQEQQDLFSAMRDQIIMLEEAKKTPPIQASAEEAPEEELTVEVSEDVSGMSAKIAPKKIEEDVTLSSPVEILELKWDNIGAYVDRYFGEEETVEIPLVFENRKVYKIGRDAFSNCKKVKQVILPDSLLCVGERAFSGSGIETIKLPEGLKEIRTGAFEYASVKEIVIPAGVKEIGRHAFYYCSHLKRAVIRGARVIRDSAFHNTGIVEFVLPECLEEIGDSAIRGMYQTITIPKSVKKIGRNNFDLGQHIAMLNDNVEVDFSYVVGGNKNTSAIFYCKNMTGRFATNAKASGATVKPLSEFPKK